MASGAIRDTAVVVERPYMRLFAFLGAMRSVHLGRSCLTEEGCRYLGVPFSFPTMAEQATWAPEAPADVRPLRVVR